jgi:hypothetical protein
MITLPVKISLLASGLFLLFGMLIGILKHRQMLNRHAHSAAPYVDIAHRAAFLYSFAMLVVAKLLEYNPYPQAVQLIAMSAVLLFLALTVGGYLAHGLKNRRDTIFRERNFTTTWYMYLLMAGEIGGLSVIIWGFVSAQLLK